jgi:hypothetical protein
MVAQRPSAVTSSSGVTGRSAPLEAVLVNFAHSGVANTSDSLAVGTEVSGVAQALRHSATSGNAARHRLAMKPDSNNANVPGLMPPGIQTAELLVSNVAAGNENAAQISPAR